MMEPSMILTLVGGVAVLGGAAAVLFLRKRTAYLGPVKEELRKEKGWLRRGEYNAAMVKGRQNLELLLKLVAGKNGIQLDNTAQAVANAREEEERRSQGGRKNLHSHEKTKKVMTYQQFNRWLLENGYLDRVARWELNQVRLIGNKAVHENYEDKDAAWNQYNYLEDILKTITEHSQNPKRHHERAYVEEQPKTNVKSKEKTDKTPYVTKEQTETKKSNHHRRRKPKSQKPQDQGKSQEKAKAPKQGKPQEKAKAQKQQNQAPKQVKKQNQPNQPKQPKQSKPVEKENVRENGEWKPRRRRRRPHAKTNGATAGTAVKTEKKNESH